jgi:integrase
MGLVAQNVADLVDAPRRDHFEITTLTKEQAHQLRGACKDDPLEALFVLALATGMRRSELLALRWQDVDLEQGVLSVRARRIKPYSSLQKVRPARAESAAVPATLPRDRS